MFNEVGHAGAITAAARPPLATFAAVEIQAKRASARCSGCAMRAVCMPTDLSAPELAKLGEALYRPNDDFQSIYAVRTGSFKTVIMHRDGREQVTGFHLIGEALG